jgi:recombination protein RecT
MPSNLPQKKQQSPIDRLKKALDADTVQQQFKNAMAENSGPFVASLIDLYGSDKNLQACQPARVIMEALKAATLKLPINRSLGFAWIIPYKNKGVATPQFQLGYKGYIQLAIRTGQYRTINADCIYEGERIEFDRLTGDASIYGEKESDKVIGYFAYIETINGFKKSIVWTKAQMTAHAKKYSKSFGKSASPWSTEFDKMALKTMIKTVLSRFGIMSTEMGMAFQSDSNDMTLASEKEADRNANTEPIDIDPQDEPPPPDEDPDAWYHNSEPKPSLDEQVPDRPAYAS